MVIFVAGLVGVGKSAIARVLADRFSFPYYAIDEVKKFIYPQDPDFERNIRHGIPFREETRMKVFQKVVTDFSHLAKHHEHLVTDECLHLKRPRQVLFAAAKEYFGGYVIVWVRADEAIVQDRLKSQQRKDHILKNPLKMYCSFAKDFEGFDESHLVCENNSSIEEATESLLSLIKNLAAFGGARKVESYL